MIEIADSLLIAYRAGISVAVSSIRNVNGVIASGVRSARSTAIKYGGSLSSALS